MYMGTKAQQLVCHLVPQLALSRISAPAAVWRPQQGGWSGAAAAGSRENRLAVMAAAVAGTQQLQMVLNATGIL